MSTTLSRVDTPTRSQNSRSALGVTPRRLNPASVGMRGSSQPLTCFSSTSWLSFRFEKSMYVMISLANSICCG